MFDLYIFDLDGTLVDTMPDTYAAVAYAARELDLVEPPTHEITKAFGHGLRALVKTLFEEEHPEHVPHLHSLIDAYYKKHSFEQSEPMPHAVETVRQLSEHAPCVVLTNKETSFAKIITSRIFGATISEVIGDGTAPALKPDPAGIHLILSTRNATRPLFVGDSAIDKETANNAHIPFCAFTGGYGSNDDLTGADFSIASLNELLALASK